MKLPENVIYILKHLSENGYEAYVAGGCVRDSLMGKIPVDWDITTSADPYTVKNIFPKTYDTGIKHGTVTVRIKQSCYEVTTYRIDGEYIDNRRPEEVYFTDDIEQDLLRRDFTMNAIAYNPSNGFVDPFCGMEDIKKRVIRGVGNPSARFQEDALRMLRAIRFAAQTGFEIDADTMSALKENVQLITNISMERVRDEIIKTLMSDNADRLMLLWDSGLFQLILPEHHQAVYNNAATALKAFPHCDKETHMRLALLLRGISETNAILRYFRFDNVTIKRVSAFAANIEEDVEWEPYTIRKAMAELGKNEVMSILTLKKSYFIAQNRQDALEQTIEAERIAYGIIERNDCISIKDLNINGENLKTLGVTDGKAIGDTLRFLLDLVLKHPDKNDYETLKSNISAI